MRPPPRAALGLPASRAGQGERVSGVRSRFDSQTGAQPETARHRGVCLSARLPAGPGLSPVNSKRAGRARPDQREGARGARRAPGRTRWGPPGPGSTRAVWASGTATLVAGSLAPATVLPQRPPRGWGHLLRVEAVYGSTCLTRAPFWGTPAPSQLGSGWTLPYTVPKFSDSNRPPPNQALAIL